MILGAVSFPILDKCADRFHPRAGDRVVRQGVIQHIQHFGYPQYSDVSEIAAEKSRQNLESKFQIV